MIYKNKQHTIETPNGFEVFHGIQKVIKDCYFHIIFSNKKELKTSPKHRLIDENNDPIFVHDLKYGTKIKYKHGIVEVLYCEFVNESIELYDIVDSGIDKIYYTNDILSHNCEFIGSVNTLINSTKLKSMPYGDAKEVRGGIDIFELPKPNHIYTLVADVSHGEGLDYSAFSIFDCGQFPYEQVAKYRSSNISPLAYPTVIQNAAATYNNAYILVETNDVGQQVVDILHHDLECDNLLTITQRGRAGQMLGSGFGKGQTHFGIKTSKKVKQIGCMNLKNLVEADRFLIKDFDTISELTCFVSKGYTYEAESGYNDDLVMTLVLFSWLTTQPHFKDLTNVDTRIKMVEEKIQSLKNKEQEEEQREFQSLVPFGIIDTGSPEEEIKVDRGDWSWMWTAEELRDSPNIYEEWLEDKKTH